MKSTFLFSYFSPSILDTVNRPLPKEFIKTKVKGAPILWIAKNCQATNGREHYIEKLSQYVTIDSYGECLNNKEFPSDKSRMELMAEHKFYLSVENSNCDEYVTEKLYDSLSMSAVPIVDGPPSYIGFIPTERSVIHMDAYPDPKDLADYINYLDNNDTAYLEYLSYRRDAIDISAKNRLEPTFLENWKDAKAFNEKSSYCSVCRGLIPWWKAKQEGTDYVEPNKDIFLVDNSCTSAGKWNYVSQGPPYLPDWIPRPRDEFTRPDFYDLPPAISNRVHDKSTSIFIANISFILLFFVFISALIRESRKDRYKTVIDA
ncbi:hypothetical protein BDF21DRAFT_334475 [Thamnidium elegans]|nr:hypothetical protein BDF21DRAFT_334475 [Thamnidium elegans]